MACPEHAGRVRGRAAMTHRTKAIFIVAALAGLVGLTGCENRLDNATPVAIAENASEAPLNPQGPGEPPELAGAGGAEVDAPTDPSAPATPSPTPSATQPAGAAGGAAAGGDEAPRVKPTVAKKQKWVKIFSGPSDKDITPPKDRK